MPEQDESLDVTLHRLLRVALRRRWWVLVPTTVIALGACLASLLISDSYESEATILVERQQVPERYVAANTTIDLREVLVGITDAILSRTQLLQIMDEFGLYPKQRKRLVPEQLVDLMRSNIKIEPLQRNPDAKDLNAFKISFTGANPRLAQQVTDRLTNLFINENNKSREEQSTGTTNFLAAQLEVADADLKQQESRVKDFKMSFLGELPEQQQGNLTILSGLAGTTSDNTMVAGPGHTNSKFIFSRYFHSTKILLLPVTSGPATAATSPTETMKTELARLRDERADLLSRYTAKYPDVVKIDEQIKETEALLAAATEAADPAKGGSAQAASQSARPTERNTTIAQLKSQLRTQTVSRSRTARRNKGNWNPHCRVSAAYQPDPCS